MLSCLSRGVQVTQTVYTECFASSFGGAPPNRTPGEGLFGAMRSRGWRCCLRKVGFEYADAFEPISTAEMTGANSPNLVVEMLKLNVGSGFDDGRSGPAALSMLAVQS